MRILNCNVTAGAVPVGQGLADDRSLVPMAWKPDPTNPSRGSFVMADCDITTGGMTITVLATGFQPFSARAVIPMPNQQEEGPSLTLEPLNPFPDPPSRADACSVRSSFQGLWIQSAKYSAAYKAIYGGTTGGVPYFGGSSSSFWAAGEWDALLDQLGAAGDTHVFVPWMRGGPGYNQPNQPYGVDQLIPPASQSADDYRAMVDATIARGFKPFFVINGEGQDGYREIQSTFADFVAEMRQGYDRLAYGPCVVCYDGVWPADWTVSEMMEMIPWMRSVLGESGYLGFMYGVGPAGNPYLWVVDSNDYQQPWCDGLDIVLTTDGPGEAQGVSMANKAQYMVRDPNFSQYQPSYHGHFVLVDNSRGPRFWGNIEWDTYGTVRDPNQTLKPGIDSARAAMVTMQIPCIG